MEKLKYPIGDSSFSYIRRNGFFYVDKSAYVYRMATEGKYYFLSRPRRFGKSLLLSTIEAYFRGERELFEGLAIEALESEWKKYPVLHLDLSLGNMSRPESLNQYLEHRLAQWEDEYGIGRKESSYAIRFSNIIRKAYDSTGMGVVVLIDEYDNPLFSTYEEAEANDEMRAILKGIYSVLKSEAAYLRFCFLTGVTRFSRMSIFSGLNNLYDITFVPSYSGICGITQQELELYCSDGIATVAQRRNISENEAKELLKEYYDGYHFGDLSVDLYNPFSLLQVFPEGVLKSYWFESGTSQFLWERVSRLGDTSSITEILHPVVMASDLGAVEGEELSLEVLLFQTGYLTIKRQLLDDTAYELGVPNKEVHDGIMNGLLRAVTSKRQQQLNADILRMRSYAENGDVDHLCEYLRSFMAGISNRLTMKLPEIYFENNLYVIFSLIGLNTRVEVDTADGRIDILMESKKYIYVIELKLDRQSSDALAQIKRKNYCRPFDRDPREVILVGVNFSSSTRNISSWEWERIDREVKK